MPMFFNIVNYIELIVTVGTQCIMIISLFLPVNILNYIEKTDNKILENKTKYLYVLIVTSIIISC